MTRRNASSSCSIGRPSIQQTDHGASLALTRDAVPGVLSASPSSVPSASTPAVGLCSRSWRPAASRHRDEPPFAFLCSGLEGNRLPRLATGYMLMRYPEDHGSTSARSRRSITWSSRSVYLRAADPTLTTWAAIGRSYTEALQIALRSIGKKRRAEFHWDGEAPSPETRALTVGWHVQVQQKRGGATGGALESTQIDPWFLTSQMFSSMRSHCIREAALSMAMF